MVRKHAKKYDTASKQVTATLNYLIKDGLTSIHVK